MPQVFLAVCADGTAQFFPREDMKCPPAQILNGQYLRLASGETLVYRQEPGGGNEYLEEEDGEQIIIDLFLVLRGDARCVAFELVGGVYPVMDYGNNKPKGIFDWGIPNHK